MSNVAKGQQSLFQDTEQDAEHPDYLSRQLITYIGNKRSLLGHIDKAVSRVKERLGKTRLRILDAFAGSGVVSRYFKRHADLLVSNDLENFAAVAGRCFLRNRGSVNLARLREVVDDLNDRVEQPDCRRGSSRNCTPRATKATSRRRTGSSTREPTPAGWTTTADFWTTSIPPTATLLLGPLLSEASVHANTSGVFKGFYKDRTTGIGKFGGSNGDALLRIKGRIDLDVPVLSRFECDVEVHQQDANALARRLRGLDLAYFDPPYNQHPYGSNYFMLNLLVDYKRPQNISDVSGIPTDWQRSDYNVRSRCLNRLADLIRATDASFILASFNDEGFIAPAEMRHSLGQIGNVEIIEIPYNTFRGSRNLRGRSIHVTEQMFLVERR